MMIYTWLNKLKSQLALLLGAAIGVLLLYISVLKRAALRKELNQEKAHSKARDRYTEVLKGGLENEAKEVKRGYFDDNDGGNGGV